MDQNKLFVGQLDYSITDGQLSEMFSEAGKVLEAKVIMDRETGRSKGFGFVTMSSPEEVSNAIKLLNGKAFGGRNIVVNVAKPRVER